MSRRLMSLATVGVVGFAVVVAGALAGGERAAADELATDRLAGADRIATAVAISEHAFPSPGDAEAVFLARSDEFADAVAAGPLTGGPVLLVPSCGQVPDAVAGEIDRLDPDEVIALGGEAAVCDDLLSAAAGERASGRIAGDTRFATAVAISQTEFPDGAEEVYVANAFDSPDAVAGGVLTRGPILLVPQTGTVPAEVTAEVDRLDPERVIGFGGSAAVSDDVFDTVASGRASDRLAGADRIETAAEIAAYQFGDGSHVGATADTVYLARGDVFADAVAGGSLADGPILLVPSCGDVPNPVTTQINRLAPQTVTALGGTAAVCDQLLAAAAGADEAAECPDEGVLVAGPEGVTAVRDCKPEQLVDGVDVELAVGDRNGGVVFQYPHTEDSPVWPEDAIYWAPPDGGEPERLLTGQGRESASMEMLTLHDVALIDDEPMVLYTRTAVVDDPVGPPGENTVETLELHSLVTGERRDVAAVGGWTTEASRVSYADGLFAVSVLDESFTKVVFLDEGGDEVELEHNPSPERCPEGIGDEEARCLNAAVLSAEGERLAYAEAGPRGGGDTTVVVKDLDTGTELGRWDLDTDGWRGLHLDVSGDRVVASRRFRESIGGQSVLRFSDIHVFDTATSQVAVSDNAEAEGLARFLQLND